MSKLSPIYSPVRFVRPNVSFLACGYFVVSTVLATRRITHQDQVNAYSPSSKDSRGRIHRTDEPTEPAKLLAIEAVDSNDATLITLDQQ